VKGRVRAREGKRREVKPHCEGWKKLLKIVELVS